VVAYKLDSPTNIVIGRLGNKRFVPGIYAYVGSARRGLKQRVLRHRRTDKKLRWHVDYLSRRGRFLNGWCFHTEQDLECALAERLKEASLESVSGFGCSDCRCRSHLFLFENRAKLHKLCADFSKGLWKFQLIGEEGD